MKDEIEAIQAQAAAIHQAKEELFEELRALDPEPIKRLKELAYDIDQLAAEARECSDLAPTVPRLLAIATFAAEVALHAESGKYSCEHSVFHKCCGVCSFLSEHWMRYDRMLRRIQEL